MTDLSDIAWDAFATLHPHEAYATWPDRFWGWFHAREPQIPRVVMERILADTTEGPTDAD